MGLMDDLYESTPRGGGSDYLKADDKDTMVQVRQPFNVRRVEFRTNPRYTDQKTGQPRQEWVLELRFLDEAGAVAEIDNGEGELAPVDRALVLTNSALRQAIMPKLKAAVEAAVAANNADGVGPFFLFKQRVQGQANPAYMIGDWTPGGAPAAAEPPPPPPSQEILSPDGRYRWDGKAWVANTPPPPPPPDVVPATPSAGATLPFSGGADAGLPEPGKSQPMPSSVSTVSGGDGEGGAATVTHVKGSEIRQAIYRGDGVVQTPSGGLVQAVAPEVEAPVSSQPILAPDGKHFLGGDGKWHKLPPLPGASEPEGAEIAPQVVPAEQARAEARADAGGIAQEATIPPPPPPLPPAATVATEVAVEGLPGAVGPTQAKRRSIPMSAKCDACGKTAKGMAFKNSKDRWIITHTCSAIDPTTTRPIGSRTIDVHEQVMAIVAEAIG